MTLSFRLFTVHLMVTCLLRPQFVRARSGKKPYTKLKNLTTLFLDGRRVDSKSRQATLLCNEAPLFYAAEQKTKWHAKWFNYLAGQPGQKNVVAVHQFLQKMASKSSQVYEENIIGEFFNGPQQEPQEEWIEETLLNQLARLKKTRLGKVAKVVTGRSEILQSTTGESDVYFLLIDGHTQSTSVDEHIYHEIIAHTVLTSLGTPPSDVFIGGGGEGATLREVLRHHSVRSAVMVDIDGPLMDGFYSHLPRVHNGSFDDPRALVFAGDARGYLEQAAGSPRTFDVIILDFPEFYIGGKCERELGGLFSRSFHEAAKSRLRPGGMLIAQAPMYDECSALAAVRFHYRYVRIAVTPMLSYPANLFLVASDDVDPMDELQAKEVDERIASRIDGKLRWYNGAVHELLWTLDRPIRKACNEATEAHCIFEDSWEGDTCDYEDDTKGEDTEL